MVEWVDKSYEEITDYYWSEIAPERRKQGYNPNDTIPTHKWLNNNRYFPNAAS